MKKDGPGNNFFMKLGTSRHFSHFRDALLQKCGEWPYSFATIVANEKILLAIAALVIFGRPGDNPIKPK